MFHSFEKLKSGNFFMVYNKCVNESCPTDKSLQIHDTLFETVLITCRLITDLTAIIIDSSQ